MTFDINIFFAGIHWVLQIFLFFGFCRNRYGEMSVSHQDEPLHLSLQKAALGLHTHIHDIQYKSSGFVIYYYPFINQGWIELMQTICIIYSLKVNFALYSHVFSASAESLCLTKYCTYNSLCEQKQHPASSTNTHCECGAINWIEPSGHGFILLSNCAQK